MPLARQGHTVALLGLALLSCSRLQQPGGSSAASGGTAPAGAAPATSASARVAPPPAFPTPPPAPDGAVSEVRTMASLPPAQVTATLGGRKGSGSASELDCGSGPQANVQCADLVVAQIPKSASSPRVQVYAKKRADSLFLGPCLESGDAIDCAQPLGGTPGASVQLVGRRPRLEVSQGGFLIRWRAMNLAAEPYDVKLVVSF